MHYMNEWDSFAAEWCRNLIAAGEIPEAIVDERSIKEVTADEVRGYVQCHWFAGVGGWPLALRLAGWDATRPIWTASCPCQPFSAAGKRKGVEDDRHLWPVLFSLIRECCPGVVVGEQVASKDGLGWLDGVFADMEGEGYACWATDTCAASAGAPHIRQRLWWVAIRRADTDGGQRGDGDEQRSGQQRLFADGGESCGLAFTNRSQRRQDGTTDGTGQGEHGASSDGRGESGEPGDADRLGDTQGERLSGDAAQPRAARGWDGGQSGVAESPCGLGHADRQYGQERDIGQATGQQAPQRADAGGSGVRDGDGRLGNSRQSRLAGRQGERGDDGAEREAAERTGGSDGPWSDYLIIPCRDGKNRRISAEPGDVPLAYGLPRKVGSELAGLGGLGTLASDHEIRAARASLKRAKRNRVGRLKGYGNAIVPYLAAEFIRTIMEIIDQC